MTRRFLSILILSLLFVSLMTLTVFAAKSPMTKRGDNVWMKAQTYAYPDDRPVEGSAPPTALGAPEPGADPPVGVEIGTTWYDYQHNGTMGRMVAFAPWEPATNWATQKAIIGFSWMYMPSESFDNRKYAHRYYNSSNGTFATTLYMQGDDEYGGYVGLDMRSDGTAIVGGHNNLFPDTDPPGDNQTHLYRDFSPQFGFFTGDRIPDAIASYGQDIAVADECIWPKFRYQEGTDTVIHVIAQMSATGAGDPQAITYFRKVIHQTNNPWGPGGSWDNPPYVVDTIFDLSHDIAASRTSDKVAIIWTANLVNAEDWPTCDTCSGQAGIVQWDNDVYYQISPNQGQSWNNRVNLTKHNGTIGSAGYRAYTDMSALMDSNDKLHLMFNSPDWPADPNTESFFNDAILYHWSEAFDDPVNPDRTKIRKVADGRYDPDVDICGNGGAWNLNIAKFSLGECDGKLYALFVMFNDTRAQGGYVEDCAARTSGAGATNGELWVSVSQDDGVTWDAARNLTNSHSPDCQDAQGVNGPCLSEHWPSMTRMGRAEVAEEDWSGTEKVDPSGGSYGGNQYLDVQFILDPDAGGIVQNEGSWLEATVGWFRLACVDPIPNPQLTPTYFGIRDPAWAPPGVELDTPLTIENTGNVPLEYTLVLIEENGPTGWLDTIGFGGSVPSGFDNTETGIIRINAGGVQATQTQLRGTLRFVSNSPSSPDDITIEFLVIDTLHRPVFDTIHTACLSLGVSSLGGAGNGDVQLDDKVKMDFYDAGDCDTTATTYLYDGSPVVGWVGPDGDDDGTDPDTLMYWSIFGSSFIEEASFRPLGGELHTTLCGGIEVFQTGTFITQDSSIAMEKIWIASQDVDSCDFIIEAFRMWSHDGQAHNDLTIGEAIDWDIPSDSTINSGSFDAVRSLIYQQGGEITDWDDTVECQNNDARFGGAAFIESKVNGTQFRTGLLGGYVAENDSFVYPAGGFVEEELYTNMHEFAFQGTDSLEDLHAVLTMELAFDLGASDVYEAFTVLGTVENGTLTDLENLIDKGKAWYNAFVSAKDLSNLLVDSDGDGILTACDNCPDDANVDQGNVDGDGFGDACDPDIDGDGVANGSDNCPYVDGAQTDSDGDGYGDVCDECEGFDDDADADSDGVATGCDNCPSITNHLQGDFDADDVGNVCDNCPTVANTNQDNNDSDTYGDECDNCPDDTNQDQADFDGDGIGDVCDPDSDGDGIEEGDGSNPCTGGATEGCDDNCPFNPNPDQADGNSNGIGDACDGCCENRGDYNASGVIDISDIVDWVAWAFNVPAGPPPGCCEEVAPGECYYSEVDCDNSGVIDISDIVYWVAWSFNQPPGPAPIACP